MALGPTVPGGPESCDVSRGVGVTTLPPVGAARERSGVRVRGTSVPRRLGRGQRGSRMVASRPTGIPSWIEPLVVPSSGGTLPALGWVVIVTPRVAVGSWPGHTHRRGGARHACLGIHLSR